MSSQHFQAEGIETSSAPTVMVDCTSGRWRVWCSLGILLKLSCSAEKAEKIILSVYFYFS